MAFPTRWSWQLGSPAVIGVLRYITGLSKHEFGPPMISHKILKKNILKACWITLKTYKLKEDIGLPNNKKFMLIVVLII